MIDGMKDRFRESTTLRFVTASWVLVSMKYVAGGAIPGQEYIGPSAYGQAVSLILGIWLLREWRAKGWSSRRGEDGGSK